MSQPYVIACDLGTSGVKVIAFSTGGETLAAASAAYDLYTDGPQAEQEAEQYWQAVCAGVASLLKSGQRACDCRGIAFGTQWRGIIPVSAEGRVLRRGIIWMDKRAVREARELNERMGAEWFCEGDYWPKLMWLRRHEPEIYNSCAYIMEANAFLKWRAAGAAASDITNCFTRSPDPETQRFYEKILSCAGLDAEKFPPLCRPEELVGRVTHQAAEELGLPEGTPVFGGCCDISALAIGSGCSRRGSVHAYLGTSGWMGYIAPHGPEEVYCPPLDQYSDVAFYGLGISVGPSTNWFLNTFYGEERRRLGDGIWRFLEKELETVPPGAGRLLAAPWFFGGRPPLSSGHARGCFINLNGSHTRAHMYQALLEGIGYLMRQNLERIRMTAEAPVEAVTVCGGGAANGRWMQALADILQVEIRVPRGAQNTGAVGVAYCALIGLGEIESFEVLQDKVPIETVWHPNPDTFPLYTKLYHQFTTLYDCLSGVFDVLNREEEA